MQFNLLLSQESTQVSIVAIVWHLLIWRGYWVFGEERKKSVQIDFQEWKFPGVREAEWGFAEECPALKRRLRREDFFEALKHSPLLTRRALTAHILRI
jgi:hypothetical protein